MITVYFTHYKDCPPREKYETEHRLGRHLLLSGLKDLFNMDFSPDALENRLQKNPYGKPFLTDHPDIYFNISHCSGLVACAFSHEDIGMDMEQIHTFSPAILKKVLTLKEMEYLEQFKDVPSLYEECFFRFWTLKEAFIKQSGKGLSIPLTDFSFDMDISTVPPVIECSRQDLYFYQEMPEPGYILSLCAPSPMGQIKKIIV